MMAPARSRSWGEMEADDRWEGFGYLGARRAVRDSELLAQVDEILWALTSTWTDEERFAWANSKLGRWFGDVVFGSVAPLDDRIAEARRHDLVRKVEVA